MKVSDLKSNKRNPRKISKKKLEALNRSLEKFGDLSGIVFNRRTGTLVSGHQRTKHLEKNAAVQIEKTYDQPTKAMTVAEGYVDVRGERFKYREVDADENWEIEALLAANKHGGDWDEDALKIVFDDFPDLDMDMTGFEMSELSEMDITFHPEESDEEYLANNKGPDSEIEKERLPSTVNDEKPKEEKEVVALAEQFIVTVNCDDEAQMRELFDEMTGRGFKVRLIT